jgi:hypothetical protein
VDVIIVPAVIFGDAVDESMGVGPSCGVDETDALGAVTLVLHCAWCSLLCESAKCGTFKSFVLCSVEFWDKVGVTQENHLANKRACISTAHFHSYVSAGGTKMRRVSRGVRMRMDALRCDFVVIG